MVYHFWVHESTPGYWAECIELDGCATQGDTIDELRANAYEALNLYLDEPATSGTVFPLPGEHAGANVLDIPVEPEIALSVWLRNYRASHDYTQQDVARKLGMRNLYSYQRLERRSNPSLQTLRRLKRVFPELSIDAILGD